MSIYVLIVMLRGRVKMLVMILLDYISVMAWVRRREIRKWLQHLLFRLSSRLDCAIVSVGSSIMLTAGNLMWVVL